jgi:hypothetical protein
MAHSFMEDDGNIIKKCREYGFCCTYDPESSFRHESVTDAIEAVLTSRAKQSEKLGSVISRTAGLMDPLQELILSAKELAQVAGSGTGLEHNDQDAIESCRKRLVKERDSLARNLSTLEEAQGVMERKYIRVPVVGVINTGKSTFLHSALGGGMSDAVKENLFPSAGAHKSCTGTRTVLIYDNDTEGVMVLARFKDKLTFLNDCRQSVRRMRKVLESLDAAGRFTELCGLQEKLTNESDAIALLSRYYQSEEFKDLCNIQYKDERDAESVHDFCSFVHFSKNQDYSEDRMDLGAAKNYFSMSDLMKSWEEGTGYSIQIPPEHEFELVKNFVCKYDPGMEPGAKRYTTYCSVQVVEIRGNLCGEIAGLELIDSVGANDDAISNEDQMRILMQNSDAMILLERPQPLSHGGWAIGDSIRFVREQKKVPNQFLYLVYNCYNNNMTIPSDLSLDIDNAHKYYAGDCKRVYVSDVGEWEEVQSKMLVDMLVNLSNSVEETHREYLNRAEHARSDISSSILAIRQTAESLGQICITENENASEKKKNIEKILQQLFGEVEELTAGTRDENKTPLKISANAITEKLVENLNLDTRSVDFNTAYEYVSATGPRYIYNRYAAFLCMYAHMLEDVKRQYNILKSDIDTYVENKRQELLKILWESGRFRCIMSDLDTEGSDVVPGADEICGWLKRDARALLADVLEDLLLQDIRAERLIDGSVGKVIEQFEPKNLTAEQLFGPQLSDPDLENDESAKAVALVRQLSAKADELKKALLESVAGTLQNMPDPAPAGQGDKKDDSSWDKILNSHPSASGKTSDPAPDQKIPVVSGSAFDLDQKVRRDVVCDDILKKFRDKLHGDDLPQNAEQPVSQLYNLYDHYYDVLLSQEEVSHKMHLNELRRNTDVLARQVTALCQN